MRVFFPGPIEPELEEPLRLHLDTLVDLQGGSELPDPPDHEWIVTGRLTPEWLAGSPRLRGIVIPFAGLPAATRTLLLENPGLEAYNLHHNAAPTAELALTLLLAAAKSVVPSDRALRRGDWGNRYGASTDLLLAGKSALVLGYGSVGRRIVRSLLALDMQVRAIRRRLVPLPVPEAGAAEVCVFDPSALSELLPTTHALIVALPLTPATEGWIGERELALLPVGSLLVNVGRGPIVDERALFLALQEGHLAGAGLDVWYRYPKSEEEASHTLPADQPFHELDNVVLSPHRGGDTRDTETLRGAHLAAALNALARGQGLPNRIDIEAGY